MKTKIKPKDRRIRRTRKLLNQALFALISEKEYRDITIREITERADVGHRTFYRHYTSKDELFIAAMKDILAGLRKLLILPTTSLLEDTDADLKGPENGRKLFAYINQQERIFRVIFQGPPVIYQSMLDLARQNSVELLNSFINEDTSPVPFEIIANQITTSTIGLMKWWLENDKPYSVEKMGEYLYRLVFKPTRRMIDIG